MKANASDKGNSEPGKNKRPDGGRSTPTGQPAVDQGLHKTPGAQPGRGTERLDAPRESGESITPPHGDRVANAAEEPHLGPRAEGAGTQDPNATPIRRGKDRAR
jgi:hypothetical protein